MKLTPLLLVAVVLASCVPAEKEEKLGKRWDTLTVMGQLQEEGVLRVGTSPDAPTAIDGEPGPYDSFALEFARYVGEVLGIDVELVEVPHQQLQTGVESEDIDMAFPVTGVTEKIVRTQAMTDPLLVSHQRLLVPSGSEVAVLDNLSGGDVCALADATTGLDVATAVNDVHVRNERDPGVCAAALAGGEVDAVTAPDVVLLSVIARLQNLPCDEDEPASGDCATRFSAEIAGDQLTTAGLSALVKPGAQAWVDYLAQVLEQWIAEGGWQEAYDAHLSELGPAEPPDLTLEEAAALYPAD